MIRNANKIPLFFPKNKNNNKNKTKQKSMQTMRAYLLENNSILTNNIITMMIMIMTIMMVKMIRIGRRVMMLDEKHTKLSMSH